MKVEIVGFGLAGACLSIQLAQRGASVTVVDDGQPSSTQVAAGLVNPVAGRNFQPAWRWTEFWPEARDFYCRLDPALFTEIPIFRRWVGEDRKKFEQKQEQLRPWFVGEVDGGTLWRSGGWLATRRFIERARACAREWGVQFSSQRSQSELTVHCTGARGLMTGPDSHRCAKGEILTVKIPGWEEKRILTGGSWVIPLGDDHYRVGATYSWEQLDEQITTEGQQRVEDMLKSWTACPYQIIDHLAGIRPIIRRSQPVIRCLGEGEWMMNGFGSKGVIYAPGTARRLAEHLLEGIPLDKELQDS